MKKGKKIYTIETTEELRLNVQKVECTITDGKGKRKAEDEICLLISGCKEGAQIVEEYVTLSLSEARKFSTILLTISNE